MKKSIIIAIIVAAVAIPAGVYAASPLFINTMIDEPAPIAASEDGMMENGGGEMTEKDDAAIEGKDGGMVDGKDGPTMMESKPLSGNFVGVGDGIHNAEGVARVINIGGGDNVLRLEEFKSTNGPDLYVYLSTDKDASDFVDLGKLKANIGNQNYDIPEGTDLSKYGTVLIWCKSFSVLFGSAELGA